MTAKRAATAKAPAEISAGSQSTSTRSVYDSERHRRARFWLIVFLLLNFTDLLTTIVAIRLGGSEANVLPGLMERCFGIPGLIVIKFAAVGVVCANLALLWRPAPTPAATRASRWLVWRQLQFFSFTFLLLTVGHSLTTARFTPCQTASATHTLPYWTSLALLVTSLLLRRLVKAPALPMDSPCGLTLRIGRYAHHTNKLPGATGSSHEQRGYVLGDLCWRRFSIPADCRGACLATPRRRAHTRLGPWTLDTSTIHVPASGEASRRDTVRWRRWSLTFPTWWHSNGDL